MDKHALVLKLEAQIARHCLEGCDALCCKKGAVVLANINEFSTVLGDVNKNMRPQNITNNNGTTFMHLNPQQCPKLSQKNLCTIYDKRPNACKTFPLLFSGNNIITISWCPALSQQHIQQTINELEKKGYVFI